MAENKQNLRERSPLSRTMHTLVLFCRDYQKYKLLQSFFRPSHEQHSVTNFVI